ncbi:MAG: Asp23/Gls24 family envelope stress response protein [Lachnospiraceae bacterium]|nr:Asp23/Gls24 family envelope stress response protein [Lachnospiraceae bacterium]
MASTSNCKVNTGLGNLVIDKDVIAMYAGSSAVECFGIVGMASVSITDGLVKLLKGDSLKHGVGVSISSDNKITVDLHIIVSYGVSISAVTENLISNVKYKVEEFAGLPVEKINVLVEGVRAID